MSAGTLFNAIAGLPGEIAEPVSDWFSTLSGEARELASSSAVLGPLFSLSPFLFLTAQKHASWLTGHLGNKPEMVADKLLAGIREAGEKGWEDDHFARELRISKQRASLLFAIMEAGGVWSTEEAARRYSLLADAAIESALAHCLANMVEGERIPNQTCGLAIFALGKHGGMELNYSSDIDIVAFYDPARAPLGPDVEPEVFYVRLIRRLVTLLDERTPDGYVFRTDIRLRPDPGATPVALPVDAALVYYESRGQNWERAAWIKARQCAGDRQTGEQFLRDLAPFIWRRHLDFATIADIQAMKRQINIARAVGEARVGGHNVKIGRGGIREIEFFTQTQQLIAGGRDPQIRGRGTCQALEALAVAGWISSETADELQVAYWFLRAVENRIQMINDAQTHTVPNSPDGIETIAHLMGFEEITAFETKYLAMLRVVSSNYAQLFVEGGTLASEIGDLVFTGTVDDEATLETLTSLGFEDARKASETIRKWHYGGYPATRAAAARANLTELVPLLLQTIVGTGNADGALARFDDFLSRFPAGVQLFSLLRGHNSLCRMLVAFMASAPRMAEAVIQRTHVMDGLLDPAFAEGVAERDVLIEKVSSYLSESRSYEEIIDRARIIGQEQRFLVAAGLISGTVSAKLAGMQFAALAETLLEHVLVFVRREFEQRHGKIAGAGMAVLAFGKLGSREMTATSDLDLILLYDLAEAGTESDGAKPLDASSYFTRLTQRLVAALSAPTAEGVLYEVDLRLRPSGNAGPLATSLDGFADYQAGHAWTWEHLALTRARVLGADADIRDKIEAAVRKVLSVQRDREKTIDDVIDMRARVGRDRKPRHRFDMKLVSGGLIDIEFAAQTVLLTCPDRLGLRQAGPSETLELIQKTGLLEGADRLIEIHSTYNLIVQVMSVCLLHPFREESWTNAFKTLLAQMANYPDFERLDAEVDKMRADVERICAAWYAALRQMDQGLYS